MSGRPRRATGRGQAIVEFALILPLFLILLMGMLEFGIVFDHRNAMAYAVREGARVGASLGNGGSQPSAVNPAILAAVQRGLTDPILVENITSIEVFQADTWGQPVAGKIDAFDRDGNPIGAAGWPATSRVPGLNGDSIGVRVVYDFRPQTPLGNLLGLFINGNPPYTTIRMTDKTVMKLEPGP
ncbi:MAG TPA: TadE family protein [Candidatus Nanopelagicales bacterium]|nr:TadE family protein [Candidatus Nanopelagicales bacterium]